MPNAVTGVSAEFQIPSKLPAFINMSPFHQALLGRMSGVFSKPLKEVVLATSVLVLF
jgi:hypothetical protein